MYYFHKNEYYLLISAQKKGCKEDTLMTAASLPMHISSLLDAREYVLKAQTQADRLLEEDPASIAHYIMDTQIEKINSARIISVDNSTLLHKEDLELVKKQLQEKNEEKKLMYRLMDKYGVTAPPSSGSD